VLPSLTVPHPPAIWLVRDAPEPTQAYALDPGRQSIRIGHENRHPDWGCVYFGVVYPRMVGTTNLFQAPILPMAEAQPQYVAIKRLNKAIVHRYLELGGTENPYKEVARMEELGDNIHVLKCIEFLEDDHFLYIVTPRACEEGTLKDAINWGDHDEIMEPERSHTIFCKILNILGYLERKNIHHRDLSPDNFLFLTPDNLVVYDLAMSQRMPVHPQTGRRALVNPQGAVGTYPCMAPEIFANQVAYDGVATDLWGCSVILYYLLTNQILYRQPNLNDISYHYFLDARGLSSEPMNARTLEMLQYLNHAAAAGNNRNDAARMATLRQQLLQQATGHLNLSDEAVQLLERLLAVDPAQRCTLAQAMESDFVRHGAREDDEQESDSDDDESMGGERHHRQQQQQQQQR